MNSTEHVFMLTTHYC